MEDLEKKLTSGNRILVAQIVSKLVENVSVRAKSGDTTASNLPEYQYLKERCVHPDILISKVACCGLFKLIENNFVELQTTIADIASLLPTIKCFPGVVNLLNRLILLDLQRKLEEKNGAYLPEYNLKLPPQHPLVTLLNENRNSWVYVFEEIKQTYRQNQERDTLLYNKLYRPVFQYTLCNPSETNLTLFKRETWKFLVEKLKHESDYILRNCFIWLQIQGGENLEATGTLLNELLEFIIINNNNNEGYNTNISIYTLWATSLLYQVLLNAQDPREIIYNLNNILKQFFDDLQCLSAVFIVLCKAVTVCPSVYLYDLLVLCETVVKSTTVNPLVKLIIKPSILNWMANPCCLIDEALIVANNIFFYLENNKTINEVNGNNLSKSEALLKQLINVNTEVYNATQLSFLLENCTTNGRDLSQILDDLNKANVYFLKQFLHFLYLTFLEDFNGDETVAIKSLNLILKYTTHNRNVAGHVLTLVLYKLSNTKQPELHFELLKALPKLAVQKQNVNKVLRTITALTNGPDILKVLSMRLMYDLWEVDNNCYPHLESLLVSLICTDKFEYFITKTMILKRLCVKRPELYGKDMVAHLSKILNECNNVDGEIPCAIAIEAITVLCKDNVIDVVTTWATLAPEFKNDTRPSVLKSLCGLLGEIPSLQYTEAYPELIENAVETLWGFVTNNSEPPVVDAALKALNCYSLEDICAKYPFKEEILFGTEVSPEEPETKLLPGTCWIVLMTKLSYDVLPLVGDFLIRIVSREVSEYLKFVYLVEKQWEPTHLSVLPLHSCVRALVEYLRKEATNWKHSLHKEVYVECLRILSHAFSKPLPPYNWCFLQELIHEPSAKSYVIAIASHQVTLSGTARRLVENYISAVTQMQPLNVEDVLIVYQKLSYLANSIQPVLFLPFFQATVAHAVELYDESGDKTLLRRICESLGEVLLNKNIQESNKNAITTVLTQHLKTINTAHETFALLLNTLVNLPLTNLTKLEVYKSQQCFEKLVEIRCETAKTNNLTCLGEIIDVSGLSEAQTALVMHKFLNVFEKHKDRTESALWVLDFIGQIEVKLIDKDDVPHILYLCDVFFLAVAVFSDHYLLLFVDESRGLIEQVHEVFPQAMRSLMEVDHWSICTTQALEWFYHMNMDSSVPKRYRNVFGCAVQALRHEDEFKKNMKWMKYFNCNVDI